MKRFRSQRLRRVGQVLRSAAIILAGAGLLGAMAAQALGSGPAVSTWTAPRAMALRRIGPADSTRRTPNFLSNLDCTSLQYRLTGDAAMRSGCFTSTAYGLLDSDNDVAIFNGTDEGVALKGYSPSQVLAPWSGGSGLVALVAVSTGGSYVSLYNNPSAELRDQYDPAGRLIAKQLTAVPDAALKDAQGRPLVANPQTMAFSSSGSWLVIESLTGSFVRINLATLAAKDFAPEITALGSPALFKSQVAISDDGRYVAIYSRPANFFKVYDLNACRAGEHTTCTSHDYLPFVKHHVPGFASLSHLRFVNDDLLSFKTYTGSSNKVTVYELAPHESIESLINYLGLGDSYTSGEGAFDYLAGTDTTDDACHLSVHSYPLLLTRDLFDGGGHSVACSGAVINDLGSTSSNYRGQARGGAPLRRLRQNQSAALNTILSDYRPGYVAQHFFVRKYQPRVATVSIGGNDIGFGDIIRKCVMPRLGADNTCYDSYEDRLELTQLIDRTLPRWTALYEQLHAESPGTQLYAIGYPQIAVAGGNCALNVHLNRSEIIFSQKLIDYLNSTIKQAAAAADIPYVDISQALAGHRLCEAAGYDIAMNGLTAGDNAGPLDLKVFGNESYHPNALGQFLIEQAILRNTHNFGLHTVAGPTEEGPATNRQHISKNSLLDAPRTGRMVNTIVPDDRIAASLAKRGDSLSVYVHGLHDGLRPDTTYSVRLDGVAGPVLRTVASNDVGDITANVVVPDDTQPGEHTLDVIGISQSYQAVDVTRPLYVPFADNDTDGDGIVNTRDTCPGMANSGKDTNRDGIDDACDRSLGVSHPAGPRDSSKNIVVNARDASGGQVAASQPLQGQRLAPVRQVLGAATASPSSGILLTRPAEPITPVGAATTLRKTDEYRVIDDTAALLLIGSVLFSVAYVKLGGSSRVMTSLRASYERLFHCRTCTKWPSFGYNDSMIWVRKGIVLLLSVILLVSLVFGVLSFSTNSALKSPAKIESWLTESKFYDNFIATVTRQAEQSLAANGQSGSASLSNTVIKQAAQTAFTPQLVQQSVNTFINSNYAWLEGKTTSPTFTIDLTKAEQNFAQQLSQSVENHMATLPTCTAAQLLQMQNSVQAVDPLTMTCLPPGTTPQSESTQLVDGFTQQLSNSTGILGNQVITASSINIGSQDRPYYQSLSAAPKVYRWSMRLPWIFAGLTLFCVLGIIFIAPGRRRGLRRIGVVLLGAGVILIAVKVVVDSVFGQLKQHVLNSLNVGQMEQPLSGLLQQFEAHVTKVDLWFGIAFVALAVILLLLLLLTRGGSNRTKPPKFTGGSPSSVSGNTAPGPTPAAPTRPVPPRRTPPPAPETPGTGRPGVGERPSGMPGLKRPAQPTQRPKRPPRLIQ